MHKYPNLIAEMAKNKIKQEDVANLLGVRPATFNLKLNGKADFWKAEIDKIMDFFNLPYEYIFFTNENTK